MGKHEPRNAQSKMACVKLVKSPPQARRVEMLESTVLQLERNLMSYEESVGRPLDRNITVVVPTESCVPELRSKWSYTTGM